MKLADFDPRRQPPALQKALGGVLIAAVIWCCTANMGSTLPELLFVDMPIHLLAGLVIDAVILLIHGLVTGAGSSRNQQQMEEIFARNGYCTEIADLLQSASSDHEKVLRAFILVMAGRYSEADEQFAAIPTQALSERDFAALMTAKCKSLLMRGKFDKASYLFQEHQAMLEAVFTLNPANAAPFAADVPEFYSLAAVFCELLQQPERAEYYRSKAIALTAKLPESSVYSGILDLQRAYAAGQNDTARSMEQGLLDAVPALSAPVTAGTKQNLRRLIDEAKNYAAARLGIKPMQRAERHLPEQSAQSVPEGLAEL